MYVLAVHEGKKLFQCNICAAMSFSHNYQLKRHLLAVHDRNRNAYIGKYLKSCFLSFLRVDNSSTSLVIFSFCFRITIIILFFNFIYNSNMLNSNASEINHFRQELLILAQGIAIILYSMLSFDLVRLSLGLTNCSDDTLQQLKNITY